MHCCYINVSPFIQRCSTNVIYSTVVIMPHRHLKRQQDAFRTLQCFQTSEPMWPPVSRRSCPGRKVSFASTIFSLQPFPRFQNYRAAWFLSYALEIFWQVKAKKTIYGKQKAQRSAENHCFCFKYSEVWYVVMNLVPSLLGNTWHGSYGSSAASRVLKSTEIGQDSVANTTCPGHSQHHLIPWQRLLSDKSSVREVNLRNML